MRFGEVCRGMPRRGMHRLFAFFAAVTLLASAHPVAVRGATLPPPNQLATAQHFPEKFVSADLLASSGDPLDDVPDSGEWNWFHR